MSKFRSNDQVNRIGVKAKHTESEYETDFLFAVGITSKDVHLIDSGATRHANNDEGFFTSLDTTYKSKIEVANGQFANVEGIGTGVLSFVEEKGTIRTALAKDVLYAPKWVTNVLSVSRLSKMGFTIEFGKTTCSITQNGKTIGVGDVSDNTYYLRRPYKVNSLADHKENCIHHWHKKLGQRDPEAIKKIQSNGLVSGWS